MLLLRHLHFLARNLLRASVGAGARHSTQVQRRLEIHASSHLLLVRARILLLLEVLECKVVRLVPNLIDVCRDKFIGGPVVVNLQLSREVVASLAQACAAGLLTIGSLHGGLAARARHLRLGSGTLVARRPCILHSVGMNGVRQSRSILTLLRQFGARVAFLLPPPWLI